MSHLYIDEDIEDEVVSLLKNHGHDVVTAKDADRADKRISDLEQLFFACQMTRAILTHNRWDFVRLHNSQNTEHFGIIVCTRDNDYAALAQRIHHALASNKPLQGKLIRVNRPS